MTHVGISFSVGIIDMMFQALSHKNYIRVFVFVVVTITGNGCQSKVLLLPKNSHDTTQSWLQETGSSSGCSYRIAGPEPPLYLKWQQRIDGAPLGGSLLVGDVIVQLTKTSNVTYIDRNSGRRLSRRGISQDVCGPSAIAGESEQSLLIGKLGRNPSLHVLDERGRQTRRLREGVYCIAPVVHQDTLLVFQQGGHLVALLLNNGVELWSLESDGVLGAPPSISEGVVFVGYSDGSLMALSLTDGNSRWTRSIGRGNFSRPAVMRGRVYVSTAPGRLTALNADKGNTVWETEIGSLLTPGLAVSNEIIVAGCADRKLYGFDAENGEKMWEFETGAAVRSTPAATPTTVYAASSDGFLYALELETGKLEWKYRLDGPVSEPVVMVRDLVVVSTNSGTMFAFERR